jgi:hypothetical protein
MSKDIINNWNKRNLSILGKITVVKSLLLPNITYIASVCTIPLLIIGVDVVNLLSQDI